MEMTISLSLYLRENPLNQEVCDTSTCSVSLEGKMSEELLSCSE